MTIYGKGCISNYRNCSLSYVWYSVLNRMLTHYCRSGHKIKKATAFIAMAFIYMMITDYSALGASSVVSAAGAAGASVAAALFLERRVRVAFLAVAVLAMFSS